MRSLMNKLLVLFVISHSAIGTANVNFGRFLRGELKCHSKKCDSHHTLKSIVSSDDSKAVYKIVHPDSKEAIAKVKLDLTREKQLLNTFNKLTTLRKYIEKKEKEEKAKNPKGILIVLTEGPLVATILGYCTEVTIQTADKSMKIDKGRALLLSGMHGTFNDLIYLVRKRRLSFYKVFHLVGQLFRAIELAHQLNLTGFNLSPETIGIDAARGEVSLTDFALTTSGSDGAWPIAKDASQSSLIYTEGSSQYYHDCIFERVAPTKTHDFHALVYFLLSFYEPLPWMTWIIEHCKKNGLLKDAIHEIRRVWIIYSIHRRDDPTPKNLRQNLMKKYDPLIYNKDMLAMIVRIERAAEKAEFHELKSFACVLMQYHSRFGYNIHHPYFVNRYDKKPKLKRKVSVASDISDFPGHGKQV